MIPAVQEMLTRKPCLPRPRQDELFSLPAKLPELPVEVRQKMVRLLAMMLNEHCLHRSAVMTPEVGGEKGFDTFGFVAECRNLRVVPHVAQNLGRRAAVRLMAAPHGMLVISSARRRGSESKNASVG